MSILKNFWTYCYRRVKALSEYIKFYLTSSSQYSAVLIFEFKTSLMLINSMMKMIWIHRLQMLSILSSLFENSSWNLSSI